ncbi:peptide ABC transporter substrate-binding protein (plasmid) [Aminobacter sp. Y103A]|uniref:ABC transporter substrate-binding protein n=1 Tax=Aminobacter sp. Y103A TaxID=1870862 RepID=UPI0025740430|nr:ABC transporter substrate-binding protein [Aminobacter sp. SS-2016]BBD40736.1 peptide ABC transporter substrate-binding protein [Aminobacter sp. SS-2016]
MKRFLPLLLGAALGFGAATSALAIERGGSMTFARYDDSTVIDPVWADRNPDLWMITSLYETLLRNGADGAIEPGLAESYAVAGDGKSISLKLRDGLKFSDGSAITGDDVVFSLDRARNPDGPWGGLLGSVEKVTAEGGKVTLSLKQPDPTIPSILATFNTGIVSKAAFEKASGSNDQEKAKAYFDNNPVTSGPFTMKSRVAGSSMSFARNPNYWRAGEDGKSLPYLDGVDFVVIPDDATRILKLQAGEVDVAEFIPFARVGELSGDASLKIELFPSTRIIYAPINTRDTRKDGSKNPLADLKVRQALNYATDKNMLIKLVTFDTGKPMTSLMSAATQLHYGPEPLYPYNPEKAKQLLAEAGADGGLDITFTTLAGSADDATLFTALQQMWAPLGVNLKVEQVDNPTRGAKNRNGEFDIHTYGWANDVNDPAQVTGWLGYYKQRQAVGTGWNNQEFNTLFEASNSEVDPAKRKDEYKRMQEIYAAEAPLLFLYETPFAVAVSKSVENYVQTPLGANDFSEAWRAK